MRGNAGWRDSRGKKQTPGRWVMTRVEVLNVATVMAQSRNASR